MLQKYITSLKYIFFWMEKLQFEIVLYNWTNRRLRYLTHHYTMSKCIKQYREINLNTKYFLTIFLGILNMFYQDRGASAVFAKLSNALAKEFPEEKLNQLHGLILGNTSLSSLSQFCAILYPKICSMHMLLNDPVFINTLEFERCSFKRMYM